MISYIIILPAIGNRYIFKNYYLKDMNTCNGVNIDFTVTKDVAILIVVIHSNIHNEDYEPETY